MNQTNPNHPVTSGGPEITPQLTVHALLEAYPQLEDVLIGMAPPFKKLKNPLLRRSVAKVATLKHASAAGGVPLDELIGKLRETVGLAPLDVALDDENYFTEQPDWFDVSRVAASIEEAKLENPDQMTLVPLVRAAKPLEAGQIVELVTTFIPAPGIDLMRQKGYGVWSKREDGGVIKTYFLKPGD
ncbi:MAG: DUF1858 domain-containing protein [Planctomycetota bacterium]|jgi:hypothetical protein